MIEMSPKALRFARLAAQRHPELSEDRQFQIIEEQAAPFSRMPDDNSVDAYLSVSPETAAFCLRAIRSLLGQEHLVDESEWDGNDFVFMTSVVQDLDRQLAHSTAQV